MLLDRHLIREDIRIDGLSREEFFQAINRVKHLLIAKGVSKGETTTVLIPKNGVLQLVSVFACLELGLPLWTNDAKFWKSTLERTDVLDFVQIMSEKDLKFLPQNRVGHVPDIHRHLPNFHIISELFKLNEGVKLSNSLAREISDMPTHDIQPWEVTPDDVAFMYTDKFWSQQENPFEDRMPSHQDILDDVTEYTSLYKDKHAGYGMSYHHHNSFVKNILPALMSAKTLSSLSFAPPMYPLYEKFLLRGIRRLRKLDIIYQVEEPMMDIALRYMVENGQDFENTLEIYTHSDLNPDWEDKLNVKFM